ncbi:phospholipase A2 inhibitor and Ly6/PLAUR domain-containing protein-like isoform X1 [Haplochromis burtoni]|uniref:phospholipase A2 inhibitor and Ly6/PLAUR domain-containing protein-like isoform X1 n=1 Tax=Haplochromis burtoni TaxID=8153 RepID=UPI001C2D1E0B|nr:phospholipase A2 inhibitor and Ly6/PLAUR domain-containing protein-like isoform X1 [Haplochromis burtoni]
MLLLIRMQILALILGILLLPKTCPLECYECIPGPSGSCNETTKECPSNTQCGSVRMISNMGGSEFKFMGRTCVTPDQCFSGSVNFGFAQVVINSKCCTSDLCNSQDVPDWSIPSPNGKKCSQCDGNDCTKTLTCNRNEDYCISAAGSRPRTLSFLNAGGETTKVKGCASKMICSNTQTAQLSGIIGGEVSCCQGDLCNSDTTTASQPSSTTAGTTTASQPSTTTAGTTTASKPSSTTAGTTTASKPSSTTAGTTTGSKPSSTTAGKSTSTILVCFVAPLIALVFFS